MKAPDSKKREWKCEYCGETFSAPNWDCYPGRAHEVALKQYYSPCESLLVCWKTDRTLPSSEGMGRMVKIAGKNAQFSRGVFSTTDPEAQEFFDTYGGCITADAWTDLHVSQEEKLRQQKSQLEVQKRQIEEQNRLLDQLKTAAAKKVV